MIFKISFSYVYLAVERARMIARQADIIAAISLEVLKGTTRAFDVCKYNNTSKQRTDWVEWFIVSILQIFCESWRNCIRSMSLSEQLRTCSSLSLKTVNDNK